MSAYELPMFPLEHPVLPGQLIPSSSSNRGTWHSPNTCTARSKPTLASSVSSEDVVGGDDVRADVGVVVRVLEMTSLPTDGSRSSLLALDG